MLLANDYGFIFALAIAARVGHGCAVTWADSLLYIWKMVKELSASNWERSEAILEFFRSHPFISSSAVANYVGYDPGSLANLINKTGNVVSIPAKYIPKFELVLIQYGLTLI